MPITKKIRTIAFLSACVAIGVGLAAIATQSAQASSSIRFQGAVERSEIVGISPTTDTVHTFVQEAGLRIYPSNLSNRKQTIGLSVYNQSGAQVPAQVIPPVRHLAANASGEFIVVVPMGGQVQRNFRVCVRYESGVDARQCGKYAARFVQ